MKLKLIVLYTILQCTLTIQAQVKLPFPILFWNVENLFDCEHDSLKNDYDFLPESLKHWNTYRYKQKLNNISKGIIASAQWAPPAIIGLCEVENERVIKDLVQNTPLRKLKYNYIVTNSKDTRGIDVALLYQPYRFKVLNDTHIQLGKLANGRYTRDILWVKGVTASNDTLNLFVIHLPSRFGGKKKSEPNRIFVINKLIDQIKELYEEDHNSKIIIMGDFNDYPKNKSVQNLLHLNTKKRYLTHLLEHKYKNKNFGTYKYKNEWGILDHLIISNNLLDLNTSFYTSMDQAQITSPSFMLIEDKKFGGYKPFRTYNGMQYLGGFSDHLPIISIFTEVLSN